MKVRLAGSLAYSKTATLAEFRDAAIALCGVPANGVTAKRCARPAATIRGGDKSFGRLEHIHNI